MYAWKQTFYNGQKSFTWFNNIFPKCCIWNLNINEALDPFNNKCLKPSISIVMQISYSNGNTTVKFVFLKKFVLPQALPRGHKDKIFKTFNAFLSKPFLLN